MRRPSSNAQLVALLFAVTLVSGCVAIRIQHRDHMPIAAARLQSPGTPVTVEGIVTVASGASDGGFALQDASGGIYVTRTPGDNMKLSDKVRVSGELVAPNRQIAIAPASIDALGSATPPAPLELRTGALGPATEGRLVAVRGRVTGNVVDDQPWGWKVFLNDGSGALLVFVAAAAKIEVTGYRAGQQLRIVGFSGRFETHTELRPRAPGDITTISN